MASHAQWVAQVDDATQDFIKGLPEWWTELHAWCNATRFRAVQDMAFHDRQTWLKAWVIRDQPLDSSAPLACYDQWLQHREYLDIGYVLANPGNFYGIHMLRYFLPCMLQLVATFYSQLWQCLYALAEIMVPPLERNDYLGELRNIADNMVRERGEHTELHPAVHTGQGTGQETGQESFPENSGSLGTPVGPAFHIPMTQDKSLEELPSQIDIEWQESVSPNLTPALATSSAVAPKDTEDNAFVEVSQIAEEAVVNAAQHLADQEDLPTSLN